MGMLEIIGLIVLALAGGIGAKMFLDIQQKEYTDERLRQTFAAQSKGMEDDVADGEFAEYQESVLEHIDSRINDGFPLLGEIVVHAGYRIKAFQWCVNIFLISIVLSALVIYLLQSTFGIWAFVFSIVLFILVPSIAYFILNMHIGQRISVFDEQFGVGLDVMSASMKSGGTFVSSIRFVAEGSEAPLSTEMGLLSTELGLGTDMNTALDRFRQRLPSKNLLIFVIAIKVANQTGASLAPILTTLSQVIVERFRLQGLVNIAVSENMVGICILGAFPWLIIPLLAFAWPEAYVEFFKWEFPAGIPTGKAIGFLSFCWYCFGLFVMYKTVKAIDT